MATEDPEQEVEELKEKLETIEDCIDDAMQYFQAAFKDGYEELETNIDKGLRRLEEAKGSI